MTEGDDVDLLAAEYALGTLTAAERASVDTRMRKEPSLATAVSDWNFRLGVLTEAIKAESVPPHLWHEIDERIDALEEIAPLRPSNAASADVIDLTRRKNAWRSAAVGAAALAASLLVFIGLREFGPLTPSNFVAVLQKDAASPAFLVTVDLGLRQMTIQPVAAKPQAGKSYELWLVHNSLPAPRSLGLVADKPVAVQAALAQYSADVIEQATLAISLEPEGGSPKGTPTGPVLYAGKLISTSH